MAVGRPASRLKGRLDLPHSYIRERAVFCAVGDQHHSEPLIAETRRLVERPPLARLLFERRAIGCNRLRKLSPAVPLPG